ncbi:MAG: inorganic diphosphatase [Rhodospirillaceae bacterium]
MDFQQIPAGQAPPWDINVVVEIPLRCDAIAQPPIYHPGNFGFVPNTAMTDGEPCEVLVVGSVSVLPGAILRSRPIGLVELADDDGGPDQLRLLAVPVQRLHPFFSGTTSLEALPSALLDQAGDFFANFRDLFRTRALRVARWGGADEAAAVIARAIEAHRLCGCGRVGI